jgi:hypothetical protein
MTAKQELGNPALMQADKKGRDAKKRMTNV